MHLLHAQVGAALPSCIQLASSIVASGEYVVANNARCTDLVQHVAFIERLLHQLQIFMARCGMLLTHESETVLGY